MTDPATVEKVARALEKLMGPVVGSPEYLADPVKRARAEKRLRDAAMSQALAALAAHEAAIKEAGMAVVPREPTEAMVWAGDEAAQTCIVDDPCGKAGAHVWADMIAASEAADLASARGRG